VTAAGRITGFSHLSVQVRDLGKALPFYRDLFGLSVSVDREHSFEAPDGDGNRVTFRRREVYLRWEDRPSAAFVVLGQHEGCPVGGGPARLQELGFDHVAFAVDDVDAVLERAREMGADILTGPKVSDGPSYGYPGEARVKTALLHDPERNIIQIDQWL
jgi:catechol 2,3-dioxygenase-like lactoylglutathione lyase family enzyme